MANPFGPTLQQATQAAQESQLQRNLQIAQLSQGGLSTLAGLQAAQGISQGIGGALGVDMRPPEVIEAEKNQVLRAQFENELVRGRSMGLSDTDAMEQAANKLNLPFHIDKQIRDIITAQRIQEGKAKEQELRIAETELDIEEKSQLMGYVKDKDGILRNVETGQAMFPNVERNFLRTQNNKQAQKTQEKLFKRGFDIAKQYDKDETVENFVKTDQAFSDLISLSAQSGQAADTGIVFRFMQIFEPNGIVREGEQEMIRYLDTPAAFNTLRTYGLTPNQIAEVATGEVRVLSAQTKAKILRAAQAIHANKKKASDEVTKRFRQLARNGGVEDLDTFVPFIGENIDVGRLEFPGGDRVIVRTGNETMALPQQPRVYTSDDTFDAFMQSATPVYRQTPRGRRLAR